MPTFRNFKLDFLRQEQHLMLPTITSILLTQNLYDVLFQYLITEEKEEKLKKIIKMLEDHIKRKDRAPFSMPISSLDFLDEGLVELRLLNWMEITVAVSQVVFDEDIAAEDYEDELEKVLNRMEQYIVFSRPEKSNLIWVYPINMVR
ncbi:MAG: hypothetical protein PHF24_02245 [Syntrophomonas sp.]|nr:hypothetical protein [Syntrophomonas sp.]